MKNTFDPLAENMGVVKAARQFSKLDFLFQNASCPEMREYYDNLAIGIRERAIRRWSEDLFNLAVRYCRCLDDRNRRLRQRIETMLVSGVPCYFVTWTIADSFYGYDEDTYCRNLKDHLNLAISYVANADMSPVERLHFHGVVCTFGDPLDELKWSYGFIYVEPVTVNDPKAMSVYIDKLSHHGIKDSARRMMYSRSKRKKRVIFSAVKNFCEQDIENIC